MRTGLRTTILLLLLAAACRGPAAPGKAPLLEGLLEVTFEGPEDLDEQELRAVVATELAGLDGRPVDKAAVDDAAYAIELFYRGKGHVFAEVLYEFEPGTVGHVSFLIDTGPQVLIERFEMTGNPSLEDDQLAVLTERIQAGQPYVRDTAGAVMRAVRDAHAAQGYRTVEVEGPLARELSKDRVALSFGVATGPRFVVREVDFEGALPELEQPLRSIAARVVGTPYVPHGVFQVRTAFVQYHRSRGYPDCEAQVEVSEDAETGDVRLRIVIQHGDRVRIASVRVEGNERVSAARIRSRIVLKGGDRFDPEKIDESFRLLYASGLFDAVRLYLEQGTGPERVLVAEVVESSALELFVEPGWGSYEGPRIRVGITERNKLLAGRLTKLVGHYSPLDQGISFLVTDPWLLGGGLTTQGKLFVNERQEPSFTYTEFGAGISVRRTWSRRLTTTLGYELSLSELSDVQVGGLVPPALLEDVNTGALVFGITRSTRDNLLTPTKGSTARFYSSFAPSLLGSQTELFDNGVDFTRAVPLRDGTVLAGSGRLSAIAPFGNTSAVPLQRRKYNGGENTVRSFRESELGPKDINGEPIGGEAMSVFSIELRQRLVGNLSGALFVDAGNVSLEYSDIFRFDNMRFGLGVGIRYLLPIGPMRLDWAANPDPRLGEDEWVLHFSVGLPF